MASEPDKWDYSLAGVPSPLTDELESQQMAKQVGAFYLAIAKQVGVYFTGHLACISSIYGCHDIHQCVDKQHM